MWQEQINKSTVHKVIAESVTDVLTTFERLLEDITEHVIYLFYIIKKQQKTFLFQSLFNITQPASQNPRGAPSRLAWVHSPGLELSAGGLFGVQLSKAAGRGDCFVLTPFAVMTVRF